MTSDVPVHLTADTLRVYLDSPQITTHRLASTPDCRMRIDPGHQTLALWAPADGANPDVTVLNRLSFDRESIDDVEWFVLEIDARDLPYEAYSLLAAIVDDLVSGRGFAQATARSVASYKDLLASRPRMSGAQVEGLIGELLILDQLIDVIGESDAIAAWLGPGSAEHDFSMSAIDAEVKTTTGERRTHVIGSATQLQTSPSRPLWLVSLQITKAGIAASGFGLPSLIARIRSRLGGTRDQFANYLGSLGWKTSDSDLYPELYVLRSLPAGYYIDEEFPAITQQRINKVVPQAGLISQLSYRVDVSSLSAGAPPFPLGEVLGRFVLPKIGGTA